MGHTVYDMKSGEFRTRKGPVFTNLLLADEINRAPAKTQAAMLEVMQESQVTLEGVSLPLPTPFMVLATQNPLEHEGTYPLPDAQLDRFLLKINIGYPSETDEVRMVHQVSAGLTSDGLSTDAVTTVADAQSILASRERCAAVRVDDRVAQYAVSIIRATRLWPGLIQGAGPRGALALVRVARAHAMLDGRDFAIPDDVKAMSLATLRHRVRVSPEAEIEGHSVDDIVHALVSQVEAPRA
jgi:MoxR-like ATPase